MQYPGPALISSEDLAVFDVDDELLGYSPRLAFAGMPVGYGSGQAHRVKRGLTLDNRPEGYGASLAGSFPANRS